MQIMALGLGGSKSFFGSVDLTVNQDKPVKKFIKPMHNHPRTATGKRIVTKAEASKQKNRRYA